MRDVVWVLATGEHPSANSCDNVMTLTGITRSQVEMIDTPSGERDSRNGNRSRNEEHRQSGVTVDVAGCDQQNAGNYKPCTVRQHNAIRTIVRPRETENSRKISKKNVIIIIITHFISRRNAAAVIREPTEQESMLQP